MRIHEPSVHYCLFVSIVSVSDISAPLSPSPGSSPGPSPGSSPGPSPGSSPGSSPLIPPSLVSRLAAGLISRLAAGHVPSITRPLHREQLIQLLPHPLAPPSCGPYWARSLALT